MRYGQPAMNDDSINPQKQEAARLTGLAVQLHRQGKLAEALPFYARASVLNPEAPDVFNNMGVALRATKKTEAAVVCYYRALNLRPDDSVTYSNLGNALRDLGRYEESVQAHRKAVELADPKGQAEYNLGLALRDLGDLTGSVECFEKMLAENPDSGECKWDLALSYLQMGEYEKGFAGYHHRWDLDRTPKREIPLPRWDGSDLGDRTLLLTQEQGFGDMIQFARFASLVKERHGGKVIIECQHALARLMSSLPGIDGVTLTNSFPPECDVTLPLLELPHLFGATLDDLPTNVPYFSEPEPRDLTINQPGPKTLKVGVVWAGKLTPRDRSCSFSHILNLAKIPGVSLFSLQKDARAEDIQSYAADGLVVPLGHRLNDFATTASVMNQMDLIITIDSAVSHLAGALGRPVWTCLLYASDWRWLMDRNDSPWYPTMKLYRQPHPNDWDPVFEQVEADLAALALKTIDG